MARPSSQWAAAAVAAVLAALLGGASAPARNALPSGQILFTSNRVEDLDGEIYSIRVTGLRKRNLSHGPRLDGIAKPSPDGHEVAFVSTRSGAIAIWVVNVDGSGLHRVSGPLGTELGELPTFSWSPNGQKIVYATDGAGGRSGVYVVGVAGRHAQRIARGGSDPSWSPDGTRIAYTSLENEMRVFVLRPNGRLLWQKAGADAQWSPDGRRIAITLPTYKGFLIASSGGRRLRSLKGSFVSWSPKGDSAMVRSGEKVKVVSLAGRASRRLNGSTDVALWSPNGKLIAFAGTVDRRLGLYVVDPAHGKPRYLGKWNWVAGWSPASDALLTNVDSALEITRLDGHRRTVAVAARTSTFGGPAYWLRGGTIVYSSGQRWAPPWDIYRLSATGRVTRLTHEPFVSDDPVLSKDGLALAFTRGLRRADCKGICESEIYLADADGRNPRRLTRYVGDEEPFASSPTWSPEGDRIAFLRAGPGGEMSIRAVSTRGGAEEVLISNGSGDFAYLDPAWSPGAGKIAFASDREGGGIFVMNRDGKDVTKLTGATGEALPEAPAWSPDGSRIAFVDDGEIYVVRADGTGKALVGPGLEPTWAPDGEWIAYVALARERTALRNFEIYAMRLDGSQSHPIMTHSADESSPSWSR